MREMVYYPGFDVKDKTWLKFALLYFDCLRPIIPQEASWDYKPSTKAMELVIAKSDLINACEPTYIEVNKASRSAIDYFDAKPEIWHSMTKEFGRNFRYTHVNREKFNAEFFNYCVKNKIGIESDRGILLPEDIAFGYMSLLANGISEARGLDMITDNSRQNWLVSDITHSRREHSRWLDLETKLVQDVYECVIPKDLRSIKLEDIINLRKNPDFSELRRAFMAQIEKNIDLREEGKYIDIVEDAESIKNELFKIMSSVLKVVIPTTVTICGLYSAVVNREQDGIAPIVGGVWGLRDQKESLNEIVAAQNALVEKHKCRRYIAAIRGLR